MGKLATGSAVALFLAGFTACSGVDPTAPQGAPGSIETVAEPLTSCGWGDGNYTRVGDTNFAGGVDLMSAVGSTVNVYEGQSASVNYVSASTSSAWGSGAFTWAADFDGDHHTDLASANGGTVNVKFSNLDRGASYSNSSFPVANVWGLYGYTFAADFTGDGRADIATATGSTINLFAFNGSGFSRVVSTVANGWGAGNCGPTCATPSGFTWAADFDVDGITDIGTWNGYTITISFGRKTGVFESQGFDAATGSGSSGYTFVGFFAVGGPDRTTPRPLTTIVTAIGGGIYINAFEPTSRRFWGNYGGYPVDNTWGSADYTWVGDFDGDGVADLASASGTNVYMKLSKSSITTFPGPSANVDVSFVSQTWTVPGTWGSPQFTRAADFTGDGKTDILTRLSGCSVLLLKSTGTGFTPIML